MLRTLLLLLGCDPGDPRRRLPASLGWALAWLALGPMALGAETLERLTRTEELLRFADRQVQATAAWLRATYPTDHALWGITYTYPDGKKWRTHKTDWARGYWPATLWRLYEITRLEGYREDALLWSTALEAKTGDFGNFVTVFLPAWRAARTPEEKAYFRDVLLAGAARKAGEPGIPGQEFAKFQEASGTYGYWRESGLDKLEHWHAFIDHLPDFELMFWAANPAHHADPTLAEAYRTTSLRHFAAVGQHVLDPVVNGSNGLVRRQGSAQRIYFHETTGAFLHMEKKQGWAHDTTWSRGQAWAVYGISAAARAFTEWAGPAYAPDRAMLVTHAKRAVEYFLSHLPDRLPGERRVPGDLIPHFDFDYTDPAQAGPAGPLAGLRDTSAASMAVAGLLQLVEILPAEDPDRARYLDEAGAILMALGGPDYLAEGTGQVSLLRRACYNYWDNNSKEVGVTWGDYYFVDALGRYRELLLPTALSLESWTENSALPAGQQDPAADPDGDGRDNLTEFALGTDPLASEPDPLAVAVTAGEEDWTCTVAFTRPSDRRAAQPVALVSTDLVTWTEIPFQDLRRSYPAEDRETVEARATFGSDLNPERQVFLRLRFALP